MEAPLVWGVFCQGVPQRVLSIFLYPQCPCSTLDSHVLAPTHEIEQRPAGQGWATPTRKGLVLEGFEHDGTLGHVGDDDVRGELRGWWYEASCHILVCGGPETQTMMQGYASAASSEAADPFFFSALKPWGVPGDRHLEPSSETRHRECGQGAETVRGVP